jgi:hypothetical protein
MKMQALFYHRFSAIRPVSNLKKQTIKNEKDLYAR